MSCRRTCKIEGVLKRKDLFGKYRVVATYDINTNDFPRTENGLIDPSFDDLYIKCAYGNQIYFFGKKKKRNIPEEDKYIMEAYVPSRQRGKNILEKLNEIRDDIAFDIKLTDCELLFKFYLKYLDDVAELLKAQLNRKDSEGNYKYVSPFSVRNLPKNKYKIPSEDLLTYNSIVGNIAKDRMYIIAHICKEFVKKYICKKKFTIRDMKAEQRKMGIKGKNYIHAKGLWNKYCDYLEKEVKRYDK